MNTNSSTNQKIAMVTGATGAIGHAIARQLAFQGFSVVLAVRNEQKVKKILPEIISAANNPEISYKIVDLGRKHDIQQLAESWQGPLHLLINNAAITPRKREETPEGVERQFAVNVLGYYWMMQAFSEVLKASAPARIVNVASYWAGDFDINDLEFKKRPYNNNKAYRQTKAADRMLTAAFAQRLDPELVTVNACHPGDVNSQLSNDLGFGGFESPDQGAETPVWLATSEIGGRVSGKYFEHKSKSVCRFGQDQKMVERLYEICGKY